MSGNVAPNIVTGGLVFYVDSANIKSYSSSLYWNDMISTSVNGLLTNGVTFSSTNNGYFVFDGVNDYINFGDKNLGLDLISKSFCAWVYLSSSLANPTGIIDKDFDIAPGNNGGWGFWVGSDRKLWWWNTSNQDIRDNGSRTIGTNTWTHVAVAYNSSTKNASFYINGTLNSSVSNSNITELSSGAQSLVIGCIRDGVGGYLSGRIANVLAYNKLLSASEILQNYNATKTRFGL